MRIQKAAVLGAGTMGAQIAAHLANARVPTLLLDIPPRDLTPDEQRKGLTLESAGVRNRIAQSGLDAAKKAKYYQIPGFREALQKFKSFKNLSSETSYNLQGVIIVPSRAAFARNPHYPYLNTSYRNKSFVFNFQIYGREDRPSGEKQTSDQQQ